MSHVRYPRSNESLRFPLPLLKVQLIFRSSASHVYVHFAIVKQQLRPLALSERYVTVRVITVSDEKGEMITSSRCRRKSNL